MPLHPIIYDNPAPCRLVASAFRLKVFAHFPVNCCLFWHHIVPHHLARCYPVSAHLHFLINMFTHRMTLTLEGSQFAFKPDIWLFCFEDQHP